MGRHKATHCKYGHEFTPENTRLNKKGFKICRDCERKHAREFKKSNPEWHRNDVKKDAQKNPERRKFQVKRWRLATIYGLTPEQYQKMWDDQNGLCYICQNKPACHIDHDHETNHVRKLLCSTCNTAIGMFYENVDYMQKAINYLKEHAIGLDD